MVVLEVWVAVAVVRVAVAVVLVTSCRNLVSANTSRTRMPGSHLHRIDHHLHSMAWWLPTLKPIRAFI